MTMVENITHWLSESTVQARLQRSCAWGGGVALMALLLVGCGPSASLPDGSSGSSSAGSGDVSMVTATPEASLAKHLTATGSAMYGAYWCPHCADQKAMFGEAIDQVPYVECAADGAKAQPDLCSAKGIQAYPTWEINGQLYPGVKSLEDLAQLSGYQPAP